MAAQDRVREIQRLVQSGDPTAIAVFDTIGCYLAHAIYTYQKFYDTEHVAVMGGISAGPGAARFCSDAAAASLQANIRG